MVKKILLTVLLGAFLGVAIPTAIDEHIFSACTCKTNNVVSPLPESNPYKVKVYKADNGVSVIRIISQETNEEYTVIATDKGNVLVPCERK